MCKYTLQVHKEICERGWGFLSKVSSPFLRIRERAQKSKGGGISPELFFWGGGGVFSGPFGGAPPPRCSCMFQRVGVIFILQRGVADLDPCPPVYVSVLNTYKIVHTVVRFNDPNFRRQLL